MSDEVLPETDKVLYEVDDHVATVTLNRPDKLNAMDPETYAALSDAWIRIRDDADVWVAIVTGAGDRAFTAGADLEETITPGELGWDDFWRTQDEMILNNGLEVWKPIIAAVDGYCLAGGMTMLLATDIRVAGADAQFGLSEVKRGILPGNGGTQRTIRQLPYPIAMEMLLTGDHVSADEAHRWGLVNEVVEAGESMETAREYADRLVSSAPLAVQAIKELAVRGRNMSLPDGIRLEESFSRHLFETDDAVEGVEAFREDREPEWQAK
ncbi:MAG: enoyl-CoA hydratase/isomerase family protein [Salinirussus sp.]